MFVKLNHAKVFTNNDEEFTQTANMLCMFYNNSLRHFRNGNNHGDFIKVLQPTHCSIVYNKTCHIILKERLSCP